jgi:hypothetical protein
MLAHVEARISMHQLTVWDGGGGTMDAAMIQGFWLGFWDNKYDSEHREIPVSFS